MTEDAAEDAGIVDDATIGQRLRVAREGLGLTVAQVAERTRISQRHLASLESGDYAALPGRTYVLGFTRTFARAVGLDPAEASAAVRRDMGQAAAEPVVRADTFEPGDPARVPSARLAWISAAVVVALLVAGYFLLPRLFVPAAQLPSVFLPPEEASSAAPATAAGPAASADPAGGAVVFTALEDAIWVKFYDAAGRQLMQKQMAQGETYTLPADAEGPQLWTGRPDALAITVGGKPVPPIDSAQRTVKDVQVSAAALLARPAPAVSPAAQPTGSLPQ